MKHILLTALLLTGSLAVTAQTFTVTARIPGIMPGCKVELSADEEPMAEGITTDGGFTLSGKTDRPILAELEISDKPSYADNEYPQTRGIKFMIESGADITIEAACIDSVPLNYEPGGTSLFLEPCVHIKGGVMQSHYQEWRNWIYNAEFTRWHAEHQEWAWQMRNRKQKQKTHEDGNAVYEAMEETVAAAQTVEDIMNAMFIEQHPDYAVSLMLQRELMGDVFCYTAAELDSISARFANNEDVEGYKHFLRKTDMLKQYPRGSHYSDFGVALPDGSQQKLSDLVKPGVWNYIDFWASWCGPCRAAIPAVKKLYAKHSDKINIVSISVDKLNESWRQAMEQEQMPWAQAIATTDGTAVLSEKYKLKSIPLLVVIDPEGNIQLATHTPAEADRFIIEKLKN